MKEQGSTPRGESPDEWYEREKAAFIAWWESEGQKKFGETPTLAAGAGWLARAAFSVDQSSTDTPARKKLGFAAAVREYGDNWRQEGFGWNGESYRGLSPATMIALSGDDGPDRADYYQMKRCAKHGRMFQL